MSTIAVDNVRPSLGGTSTSVLDGLEKANVRYAHVAGTPTASRSFNVSSLTDDGTGLTDINFTSAFDAEDYVMVAGGQLSNIILPWRYAAGTPTTSVAATGTRRLTDNATVDVDEYVGQSFQGDLA